MRRGLIIAAGLLGGCDDIFGLQRTALPPDSLIDTLSEQCRVSDPRLTSADTFLLDDKSHGNWDVLEGRLGRPILLKFDITGVLAADEHVAAANIRLDVVDHGDNCNVSCGPCTPLTAMTYSLRWMTTDWAQDATSVMRTAGVPWTAPFAADPIDRSDPVSTGSIPPLMSGPIGLQITVADSTAVPAAPWLGTNRSRLAVQLNVDGFVTVSSAERPGNSCNDTPPRLAPSIVVTACR